MASAPAPPGAGSPPRCVLRRYAAGLVLKGLEWPDSQVLGHHELMHGAVIVGNGLGLLVDALTT